MTHEDMFGKLEQDFFEKKIFNLCCHSDVSLYDLGGFDALGLHHFVEASLR